eukprot:UN14523
MSILVPFLVFAIGVSHGVQMINAIGKRLLKVSLQQYVANQALELYLCLAGLRCYLIRLAF